MRRITVISSALFILSLVACAGSKDDVVSSPTNNGNTNTPAPSEGNPPATNNGSTTLPEPTAATALSGGFRPKDIVQVTSGTDSWAELRLTISETGFAAEQQYSGGTGGCASGVREADGDGIVLLPNAGEKTFLWNNTTQVTRVKVRLENGVLHTEATTDKDTIMTRDFVPGYVCYDRVNLRYIACSAPEYCI